MHLPDPDDPEFKAFATVLRWHLIAAGLFLSGFMCLVIALLT